MSREVAQQALPVRACNTQELQDGLDFVADKEKLLRPKPPRLITFITEKSTSTKPMSSVPDLNSSTERPASVKLTNEDFTRNRSSVQESESYNADAGKFSAQKGKSMRHMTSLPELKCNSSRKMFPGRMPMRVPKANQQQEDPEDANTNDFFPLSLPDKSATVDLAEFKMPTSETIPSIKSEEQAQNSDQAKIRDHKHTDTSSLRNKHKTATRPRSETINTRIKVRCKTSSQITHTIPTSKKNSSFPALRV